MLEFVCEGETNVCVWYRVKQMFEKKKWMNDCVRVRQEVLLIKIRQMIFYMKKRQLFLSLRVRRIFVHEIETDVCLCKSEVESILLLSTFCFGSRMSVYSPIFVCIRKCKNNDPKTGSIKYI